MKTPEFRFNSQSLMPGGCHPRLAWLGAAALLITATMADTARHSAREEKIIVESGEAAPVTEAVRAAAPGTLVAVLVKPGDIVKKGQVLGHTELAATQYQLDLARLALENTATVTAAEGHAEAWTATREETEKAVRKRTVEGTRLDWARGMEKFHRANHEAQLEQKKVQRVQYEYWQRQYEARFMRAPVDGVVTHVLCEPGKTIGYAAHVFTVSNEKSYLIPVSVPARLVRWILDRQTLPMRSTHSRWLTHGKVDSIIDDPAAPDRKIVRLLVTHAELPAGADSNPTGMTFDVLLPQETAHAG